MLVAVGCSSNCGGEKKKDSGSSSSAATPSEQAVLVVVRRPGQVRQAARPVQGAVGEDDRQSGAEGEVEDVQGGLSSNPGPFEHILRLRNVGH